MRSALINIAAPFVIHADEIARRLGIKKVEYNVVVSGIVARGREGPWLVVDHTGVTVPWMLDAFCPGGCKEAFYSSNDSDLFALQVRLAQLRAERACS